MADASAAATSASGVPGVVAIVIGTRDGIAGELGQWRRRGERVGQDVDRGHLGRAVPIGLVTRRSPGAGRAPSLEQRRLDRHLVGEHEQYRHAVLAGAERLRVRAAALGEQLVALGDQAEQAFAIGRRLGVQGHHVGLVARPLDQATRRRPPRSRCR